MAKSEWERFLTGFVVGEDEGESMPTPGGSLDDRMPNACGGDHDTPYNSHVDYYLSVRQTAALVRLRRRVEQGRA